MYLVTANVSSPMCCCLFPSQDNPSNLRSPSTTSLPTSSTNTGPSTSVSTLTSLQSQLQQIGQEMKSLQDQISKIRDKEQELMAEQIQNPSETISYYTLMHCDIILYALYSINDYSRSSKESHGLVESGAIEILLLHCIYCCCLSVVCLL